MSRRGCVLLFALSMAVIGCKAGPNPPGPTPASSTFCMPSLLVRDDGVPSTNGEIYAIAVHQGKVLIGGAFDQVNGQMWGHLARLTLGGGLDFSFKPNITGTVRAIKVDQFGRILIGGDFTIGGVQKRNHIARLNKMGQLDATFGPNNGGVSGSIVGASTVNSIAIGSGIVIGGDFTTVNGNYSSPGVARLIMNGVADGQVDKTFSSKNNWPGGPVTAVAVDSMDRVVIGGNFTTESGGWSYHHILRLKTSGGIDTSFSQQNNGPQEKGPSGMVNAIRIDWADNVVFGGAFTKVNGVAHPGIARWTPSGTFDPMFYSGAGVQGTVNAVEFDEAGRIVIGGAFSLANNNPRGSIARLESDGTIDKTLVPSGDVTKDGNNGTVYAILPNAYPCSSIIVGGLFKKFGINNRGNIVRVTSSGSYDAGF